VKDQISQFDSEGNHFTNGWIAEKDKTRS